MQPRARHEDAFEQGWKAQRSLQTGDAYRNPYPLGSDLDKSFEEGRAAFLRYYRHSADAFPVTTIICPKCGKKSHKADWIDGEACPHCNTRTLCHGWHKPCFWGNR